MFRYDNQLPFENLGILMKCLVCSSIERVKRQDKSSSTTLNMECIIREDIL